MIIIKNELFNKTLDENGKIVCEFVNAINKLVKAPIDPITSFDLRVLIKKISEQEKIYEDMRNELIIELWEEEENWTTKVKKENETKFYEKMNEINKIEKKYWEKYKINLKKLYKEDKPLVLLSIQDMNALDVIIDFIN